MLAHVDPDTLPLDLQAFAVDVPVDLGIPTRWAQWDDPAEDGQPRRELPGGWRDVAQPLACRAVGDAWLATPDERRTPLLRVPTAVLPPWAEPAGAGVSAGSWCAVLDPNHAAAASVRVGARHAFSFDARLLRRV